MPVGEHTTARLETARLLGMDFQRRQETPGFSFTFFRPKRPAGESVCTRQGSFWVKEHV